MKIHLYNRQRDLLFTKTAVRHILLALSDFLSFSCEEIAFYFVSKKEIASLHAQFFKDPTPTDCITFPLNSSHLGEVVICPAIACDYAKKRGLDPRRELLLYLIHGLLHLLGFEDKTPHERQTMRKKEKSCMRHLTRQGLSL